MSPHCQSCVHFRPERQPSDLLDLTWSSKTAETLERNRELERQLHTAECKQKRSLMEMNRLAWPRRPQVLAYCGLREKEDIHLIHEMKNRGGICQDFRASHGRSPRQGSEPARRQPELERARPEPVRACDACRYQVAPRGPQRDYVDLRNFTDPSLNAYNNGMAEGSGSSSRADAILGNVDRLMNASETRKALEMRLAMHSDGSMPSIPEYYAHCAKYSEPGRFVLCRSRNPHNQCPAWSARDPWSGGMRRR